MHRWLLASVFFALGAGGALYACDGDATSGDAGFDSGADSGVSDVLSDVSFVHRPAAEVCDASRGPGSPAIGLDSGCNSDEDCEAGLNGRCENTFANKYSANVCTYDTCESDDACANHVCACRGTYFNESTSGANTCIGGNCRVDSDCASGLCSPSNLSGCGVRGYYCRSADDECTSNADCSGGSPTCAFDKSKGHFACQGFCADF